MQMNLFEQNAKKINEAEQLETDQEEQMALDDDFFQTQQKHIERDSITDIDFGPWGVKWRGANIPLPESSFADDHIAQFGFTCAGCGASVVNQEKLIHGNNCDSKSPHHIEEEVEYE